MNDNRPYRVVTPSSAAELAAATQALLTLLPAWFGRPETNREYVTSAKSLPGILAYDGDEAIGVALYRKHFPQSAEIHLLAVAPGWHRRGVGRAVMKAAEKAVRADGCSILQVKTLGASDPDAGYAATRLFYQAEGFIPLEEFDDLWPDTPCLMLVKTL